MGLLVKLFKDLFGTKNFCKDCVFYENDLFRFCLNENLSRTDPVTGEKYRRYAYQVKKDFCYYWEKKPEKE